MNPLHRFRDWRHERHIQHLADACKEAMEAGDKAKARHFWQAMAEAIKARSPAQVERMEERMGLRLRRSLKQRTFDAFCRGWAPAWLVHLTFRLFKLRSL